MLGEDTCPVEAIQISGGFEDLVLLLLLSVITTMVVLLHRLLVMQVIME